MRRQARRHLPFDGLMASLVAEPAKAEKTASTRVSSWPLRSNATMVLAKSGGVESSSDPRDLRLMLSKGVIIGRGEVFGPHAVQWRGAKGRGPVFQQRVHLISHMMVTSALTLCSPIATGTILAASPSARHGIERTRTLRALFADREDGPKADAGRLGESFGLGACLRNGGATGLRQELRVVTDQRNSRHASDWRRP